MKCEAIHCYDRGTVRFAVYPDGMDGPRVLAEVSEDALRDVLGASGGPESLLLACELNFPVLEEHVVRRFKEDPRRAIYLETRDLLFVR
ncbi:hypothetical protein [Variovorax soli]|uniref:hypothetical protein n=1 Tax=Variovorax soli TaxID=376815 RepID=UPI0008393E0B|nr:hypothetical protein [Variovorax soli]